MMMMNIYNGELQDLDRSLPVFDGVEDSLENIKGNSNYINKAVWQGWKSEDVPGMTLRSFNQTMRFVDMKSLSRETQEAIGQEFVNLARTQIVVIENLAQLQQRLVKMTAENRARKRAMDSFALSSDHMAGADAPYFKDGQQMIMKGYDVDAVTEALNVAYEVELEEITNNAKTKKEIAGTQQNDQALKNLISPISEETGVTGTRRVQGDALAQVIDKANLTTEQEQVLLDVMKNEVV